MEVLYDNQWVADKSDILFLCVPKTSSSEVINEVKDMYLEKRKNMLGKLLIVSLIGNFTQ